MASDDNSKGKPTTITSPKADFWYANAVFFVGVHVAACLGIMYKPPWVVSRSTVLLAVAIWQLGCFGVTIGYHRLYSHRAFRATWGVRLVLAMLGAMAFQGSIKWWCLRHRLHHRFTDHPVHDPYAATRGLFFSHMGWIFFKPKYGKMDTINKDDLESDPVARFQHKYYVPLALSTGFLLPTALGMLWGDSMGAFIWGGLVSRLAIWHCTFLVNSLAHWDGLQPYTDENTSRGNLIMALLTCGEGNHNFHAFPHDFRSGPSWTSWDPSKWIIFLLHRFGLVTGLRRARNEDIRSAEAWMRLHGHSHNHGHLHFWSSDSGAQTSDESTFSISASSSSELDEDSEWEGPVWDDKALKEYVAARPGRCVVLLDGYAVDVTRYMGEHPGGALLLRQFSVRVLEPQTDPGSQSKGLEDEKGGDSKTEIDLKDRARETSAAFHGGLNNHSRAARRRERQLRVARIVL